MPVVSPFRLRGVLRAATLAALVMGALPGDARAQPLLQTNQQEPPPGSNLESTKIDIGAYHVWGTKPSDVWLSGEHGSILHWDGVTFSPVASGVREHLQRLWGSGPDDIWAVGNTESAHWDGKKFSAVPSAAGYYLTDIWGANRGDAWAVGRDATVLRLVKNAFVRVPISKLGESLDPHIDLLGVWGSSAKDVWVVGTQGTVLRWNGARWQRLPTGVTVELRGIWGSGADDVWLVGESQSVLHWDGKSIKVVSSGVGNSLNGVWGSAANDVWMVGDGYTIYHWNGAKLIPILRQDGDRHTQLVWSVWGSGPRDVWMPTAQGTVLRYRGGSSYVQPKSPAPVPCQPGATSCSNEQVLACNGTGKAWGVIGDCHTACNNNTCQESCEPGAQRHTALGPVRCAPDGKTWASVKLEPDLITIGVDGGGKALLGGIPVSTNLWDCASDVGVGGPGHRQVSMAALIKCPTMKYYEDTKQDLENWKRQYLKRSSK